MDSKTRNRRRCPTLSVIVMAMVIALGGLTGVAHATDDTILHRFNTISTVASTVPANGDVNPYGVAEVTQSVGKLIKGHILVSNFNNSNNVQGTGTTIVDVAPDGTVSLFAKINPDTLPGLCPGGVGLTTALAVLRSGWVIVGSLPTTDDTIGRGCLIVLDSMGNPVDTFFGSLINGPWDMVAFERGDQAKLFVTNVLNGTVAAKGDVVNEGTVVRIDLQIPQDDMPQIESITVIGSGFAETTDPNALVIGPTGVGISPGRNDEGDHHDFYHDLWRFGKHREQPAVLYIADTLNNRIALIPDALERTTSAGTGFTLSAGGSLNGPLGLVVAPNGHILTVNGGDGFITEITPKGKQIAKTQLDNTGSPPGAGTLFGLAFDPAKGVYFVDNGSNTLNLLH